MTKITLNILEDDRKLTKFIIDYFNITDIKIVKPIIYKINKLTILYYKCEDIKERKYYIPKLKQDYNLSELKSYLKGILQ